MVVDTYRDVLEYSIVLVAGIEVDEMSRTTNTGRANSLNSEME